MVLILWEVGKFEAHRIVEVDELEEGRLVGGKRGKVVEVLGELGRQTCALTKELFSLDPGVYKPHSWSRGHVTT